MRNISACAKTRVITSVGNAGAILYIELCRRCQRRLLPVSSHKHLCSARARHLAAPVAITTKADGASVLTASHCMSRVPDMSCFVLAFLCESILHTRFSLCVARFFNVKSPDALRHRSRMYSVAARMYTVELHHQLFWELFK